MKALVIGATGATGKDLVAKLLEDPDFEEVHIFVRKAFETEHPKLTAHLVNFDHPEKWQGLVRGDVAFSCLGTTLKTAGSKDEQRKVDFDYQYNFAKIAKENEVEDYILVSSYGADPDSKIFYTRMKGELEREIEKLNFNKMTIFQPGILERKNSERPTEILSGKILNFANKLGVLEEQKPLPTNVLAQAMINASKIKSGGHSKIMLGSIFSFARRNDE